MEVVIPIAEDGKWEIERFKVFNSCLLCKAKRVKASLGTIKSKNRSVRCYTADCNCEEILKIEEIIEENSILEILYYYNIRESSI